jgi:hypothetical protein
MSDYKAIVSSIDIVDRALVARCLGDLGIRAEFDVVAKQRWSSHNRQVDICIRQNQLPEHLRGFGDVGLINRGGKFVFLGCSESDSSFMDRDARERLRMSGMSERDAVRQQPDGKFAADMREFFSQVENGYAMKELQQQIAAEAPSVEFQAATGKAGDPRAWMVRGSVTAADLRRMGVEVPA